MPAPAVDAPRRPRSKWIRGGGALEVAAIYGLYRLYSWFRNEPLIAPSREAFRNARHLIHWQELLWMNHEQTMQKWFLGGGWHRWFIGFWNLWYGSVHFVTPIITLWCLYRFDPGRYVRWRNVFLWMLPLALLGFWLFPLMPPRLLPSSFGFIDTRLYYFTIGKPVPHARQGGNLFAAMPSLHIAWATWTLLALWPLARRWWVRAILVAYPPLMIFATVVTANHFFLDAVGGWVVLAIAYALARAPEWIRQSRRARDRGASWTTHPSGPPRGTRAAGTGEPPGSPGPRSATAR